MEWLEQIPLIGWAWSHLKAWWVGHVMPEPLFLWPTQGIGFTDGPDESWRQYLCAFAWRMVAQLNGWMPRIRNSQLGRGQAGWYQYALANWRICNRRRRNNNSFWAYLQRAGRLRDQRGDGTAFLTNSSWIISNGSEKKWPLPPGREFPASHPAGRYEFWMEVRSSGNSWRSPHRYVIHVPPAGIGNGFFTIEADAFE